MNALIVSLFLFAFLRSIGNCAFLPWMYSILPLNLRGRYFANEQIYAGVAGVGTLVACSVLFYWLSLFDAFMWQYGIALAGALFAWWALKRIPDGEKPGSIDLKALLKEAPRLCIRRSRYRQFLWMSVLFVLGSSALPPFSIYYLRVEAGLAPSQIILFTMLQYLGAIAGSLFIRKLIDRTGPRLFFRVSAILYIAVAVAWWNFLQHGGSWVLPLLLVYFVLGMAASSWVSANLNYLPRLTSDKDRPLRISVHGAVTAFLGGISPIVWGVFLRGKGDTPTMNTTAFQIFFVFLLISHLILLWNVRYLRAAKTDQEPLLVSGALGRPIRSMGFLVNLIDLRRKPK